MAQHARGEVALPAPWVDQAAIAVLGHGVDGQVAARQVFFQGDVGRGVEGKAVVAPAALALGAGEGVLFVGLRVQEDGAQPTSESSN